MGTSIPFRALQNVFRAYQDFSDLLETVQGRSDMAPFACLKKEYEQIFKSLNMFLSER